MITAVKMTHDVEYRLWLKKIDHYKAELNRMQRQLEDFLPFSQSVVFGAMIEQFQNRFIRQREVIDILRHDVKSHENDLEQLQAAPEPNLREKVSRVHMRLRREMQTFVDLFVELEQDFNDFQA